MALFFSDSVSSTVTNVKINDSGYINFMKVVNTTAATAYLQIFNLPYSAVVLGTTTPTFVIRLNANESVSMTFTAPLALGHPAGASGLASGIPPTQPQTAYPTWFPTGSGVSTGSGISIAGTTTATGSTGAAISVAIQYV